MVNAELGYVLLFVKNPHRSASFYSELFGLKPIEQSPTFVLFRLANGVMLGLWSCYTAEPRVDHLPGGSEICFAATQVDSVFEEWGKLGVTIIQKPTEMDFGRTFVAIDPDGHRIRVYKLRDEK